MSERDVFTAALGLTDPGERSAYLNQACAGNPVLRQRIELLLRTHGGAGDFLERPALEQLAAAEPSPDATQALNGSAAGDTPSNPKRLDATEIGLEPAKVEENEFAFLQSSTRPDSLGRLAQYEILEVLGRGGFGVVLKAFDVKLHRMVAVKVLGSALAGNATARKRFVREARAAAAVSNEHVVGIYGVDEEPVPYLVMEYIAGQTLQQKLDRSGPLELKELLRIGCQIADGLAAAHRQGLIHRDIKPGNILLENGVERVKITDFGLARAADDASLTQSGMIAGTPMYMAPEQAQAEEVDHRADLFSLGSVLYVMCTGRPPFRASNTLAVLKRVCEETPRPIREVNPDVPQWLCDLISQLHAKKPEDRIGSAKEVADVLAGYLAEVQQRGSGHRPDRVAATPARTAAPVSRRRRWVLAGAALLVLLAVLGVTEATDVTDVRGTVIRLFSPHGTLVLEVDDPGVSVSIDGEDLVITGTGIKEIRLKPGQHQVQAIKDGKVIAQELITVTRNGQRVLRVSREGQLAPPLAIAPLNAQQAEAHQQAWARHLGTEVATTNSLGMKLVLIPPGKFVLGSKDTEPGWNASEGPQHEVEISRPFAIGAHEVTVGQFKAFVKATNYVTETEKLGGALQWDFAENVHKRDPAILWMKPGYEQTDDHPVVCVTWNDAQAFCKWLSEKEGVSYTLPTEAQWEYACRAGTTTTFSFGDDEDALEAHAWIPANAEDRAHAVGQKRANAWGLYDVHGNAWEWTGDFYGEGYYAISPKVDPSGADTGARVMRGGCRIDGVASLRSGARGYNGQDVGNNVIGFRVVAAVRRSPAPASVNVDAASWEKSVAGLPAEEQVQAVVARLEERNPRFDASVVHRIDGGQVTELELVGSGIRDLSPVRALPALQAVRCIGNGQPGVVAPDLSALKGMRLREVSLRSTPVMDLTPLAGLPITSLELSATQVSDLSPLRQMPLTGLHFAFTPVKDLSPLKGMKLQDLNCDGSLIEDLTPLEGQPLTSLNVKGTKVSDFGPLKGMPLVFLDYTNTPVTDITPLKGIPLKDVRCDFQAVRDAEVLRSIKTLQTINGKPVAEFWKEVEQE